MNYKNKNLKLIKQHYNNLYQQIYRQRRNVDKYVIRHSNVQLPNLWIQAEDKFIPLHSQYDPVNEADRWLQSQQKDIQKSDSILIYGFGLGYHIERIIDSYPNKTLYIYEPDTEILLAAIEVRDLNRVFSHSKIKIISLKNGKNILFNILASKIADSFATIIQPAYKRIFKDDMKEFNQEFRQIILNERVNIGTYYTFQEAWPENIIKNMIKNLQSAPITHIRGKFKDIPAIIAGSGPSLDIEINHVRDIRKHALIFAAGSSIQGLLANGINPDMIGSLDGGEAFLDAFRQQDYGKIPMLYAPTVKHDVIEPVRQHLFHCFINSDILSTYFMGDIAEAPVFNSTMSVTGLLIQAAAYMGCNPIIFVGQDLSYPNKQIYAQGVTHINSSGIESIQASMKESVENVVGGENPTTVSMLSTLRNMGEVIQKQDESTKFINSSTHGAKIKGADYIPLSQVLDDIKNITIDRKRYLEILNYGSYFYSQDQRQAIARNMERLSEELKSTNVQIIEMNTIINQLEVISERKELINKLAEADKLWNKIAKSKIFNEIYQLLVHAQLSIFTRYIPMIEGEKDAFRKAKLITKYLGLLVSAMVNITPKLIGLLDITLSRIYEEKIAEQENKHESILPR